MSHLHEIASLPEERIEDTQEGHHIYYYNRLAMCYCIYINKIYKKSNLRKEIEAAIKSEETSSQIKAVRNNYVAIMHQPVTVSSNM